MKKVTVGADVEDYTTESSDSSKYTQPLLDTPHTVVVIPQQVIAERNATTLRDVLRNTPGITFQAGEGGGGLPGDQNFSMRGFSARNSVFSDGIRDAGSYTRDAFNLDSVEVAKGPTGSIGGRSSTSGAINQISKAPRFETSHAGTLGLGLDDYKRATADINQAFGDSMALRVNMLYHDAEVSEREVVETKRWGIAPSFAMALGDATTLTLSYLYQEEDNVPDYGLPWVAITQNGVTYPTGAFDATPPVEQSNFYGLRDYDFEDLDTQVATATFEHSFSNALRLENVTRYTDNDRNSAITAPRQTGRQLQRREMSFENLTNQTNLVAHFGTGAVRHDVVTGVEFANEDTASRNSAQATNQPNFDLYNPNPDDRPFGPMPPITGNPSTTDLTDIGVYAFDTIHVSEHWELSGGLRYDDVDIDYEIRDVATGVVTKLDKSEGLLSWNAGVVYKPRAEGSVYLSYGTAQDPTVDAGAVGAGLSLDPNAANNINLDPEESDHYELGVKWNLYDAALAISAAAFRTEKTNVRTRLANNVPYVLSGEQVVNGIELGVAGNITDHWSAFGGYVYLDAKIDSSANPIEVDGVLLQTPENSLNLWTTYAFPFGLTIGAGAQFLDEVVRARSGTVATGVVENILESYWLVDAMASYTLTDSITLRLNATNLTDEFYVDRIGGGHYVPGAGRAAFLTADIRF